MKKPFSVQFSAQKMLMEDEHPDVVFSLSNEGLVTLLNNDYQKKFKPIDGSGSSYYVMKNEDFDAFVDQASQYIRKPMDYIEIKNEMRPDAYLRYEPKQGSLKEDGGGSATGTGASFSSGTGEQYAPGLDVPKKKYAAPYAKKSKKESKDYSQRYQGTQTTVQEKKTKDQKDVEPKLAAGKAKNYVKDKWGWKEAPSIPNRPTKGGFIYKDLWEGKMINENYSRFKKETRTRDENQQYHEAIKLVRKKLAEANKVLEYSSRLKEEFPNGPYYEAKSHTKKSIDKLKKQVAEAYKKIKNLS